MMSRPTEEDARVLVDELERLRVAARAVLHGMDHEGMTEVGITYTLRLALVRSGARACCSNPKPQLMYDHTTKKRVLQCMNCSAFVRG